MTDKEYVLIRIKTKRKTMTDYKKLCEELRSIEKHEIIDRGDLVGYRNREPSSREHDAADAIEELQAENERLRKQFEAAVEDLKSLARRYCVCYACVNNKFDYDKSTCMGCEYNDGNNWEWRGEQE